MKDRKKIEQLEGRLGLMARDLDKANEDLAECRENLANAERSASTWQTLAHRTVEEARGMTKRLQTILDDVGPPFVDRAEEDMRRPIVEDSTVDLRHGTPWGRYHPESESWRP